MFRQREADCDGEKGEREKVGVYRQRETEKECTDIVVYCAGVKGAGGWVGGEDRGGVVVDG